MTNNINKRIGTFISQLRKENHLTQEQFAEKLGVTNRSVSRWENGKTLPDISLMQYICEEFNITILELLNGERQVAETVNLKQNSNLERDFDLRLRKTIDLIIELSRNEKEQKRKVLTCCFSFGILFLSITFFQGLFLSFGIIKAPFLDIIQTITFSLIGITFEIAGFYYNSQTKEFTAKEIDILLQDESNIRMKTGEEMLQYAKKYQKNALKQHKRAFEEISQKLGTGEYVIFSMLADEYMIKDQPGPWHVGVAVTNKRFFVCGETISGRLFTRYDMDVWGHNEIYAIQLENKNIIVETSRGLLKLKGENLDTLIFKLEKALK